MTPEHDQSGSAFPHFEQPGITVRDFFFAAALQGLASRKNDFGLTAEEVAEQASEMADESLDQREFPRKYRIDLRRAAASSQARVAELEQALKKLVDACQIAGAGLEDHPVNREAYRQAVNQAERAIDPDIPF